MLRPFLPREHYRAVAMNDPFQNNGMREAHHDAVEFSRQYRSAGIPGSSYGSTVALAVHHVHTAKRRKRHGHGV